MKWSAVHYYRLDERTDRGCVGEGERHDESRSPFGLGGRGARLWTVALLLVALSLTLASVAVAAEGELPAGHVTPAFGPAAGGTAVTISGSGFTGATGVTFDGVAATNVAINGDGTAITATTPAHDVGAAPVVVAEADGTLVTVGGFFFIRRDDRHGGDGDQRQSADGLHGGTYAGGDYRHWLPGRCAGRIR